MRSSSDPRRNTPFGPSDATERKSVPQDQQGASQASPEAGAQSRCFTSRSFAHKLCQNRFSFCSSWKVTPVIETFTRKGEKAKIQTSPPSQKRTIPASQTKTIPRTFRDTHRLPKLISSHLIRRVQPIQRFMDFKLQKMFQKVQKEDNLGEHKAMCYDWLA